MSYGLIKKCTRCGRKVPHHHELDDICMHCEMDEYYPEAGLRMNINELACDVINDGNNAADIIAEIMEKI